MSISKPAVLAVIAALGLLLVGAVSASAHTVLRTDPGGQPLIGPTQIAPTSGDHFTIQTQTGFVTCATSTFTADVNGNTSPTSIPGRLTRFTAQGCTDSLPAVNITSCHLENLPALHITADISIGGTFLITDPILRCALANGINACYYTSPVAPGQFDNLSSELTFKNVPAIPLVATQDGLPPGPCGHSGAWSVTFTHVVQELTNQTLTVSPF
jgi:hypothetical protein